MFEGAHIRSQIVEEEAGVERPHRVEYVKAGGHSLQVDPIELDQAPREPQRVEVA